MKERYLIWLAVCAVGFAGLLLSSTCAVAAETAPPQGKLDATVVKKVEWELRTLARKLAEQGKTDKETIFAFLANYLWKNPEIHGAAFAVAPETRNGKEVKSCPYIYRNGEQLIQKDLSTNYDYTAPEQKWYAKPVKLGRPVWSEPALDLSGSGAWVATYSIPVYAGGKERHLVAVVTSEVVLPSE
jgi:hypothetical protein